MDNNKLLEFAGFKHFTDKSIVGFRGISYENGWIYPDGCAHLDPPDFTESLDACFKWLVPKAQGMMYMVNLSTGFLSMNTQATFHRSKEHTYSEWADTPALALCLAIEALIDGEDDGSKNKG